MINSRSSLIVG